MNEQSSCKKRKKNAQIISKSEIKKMPTQPSSDKKKMHHQHHNSQLANVNVYQHFLTVPSANSSAIEWAFNLRSSNPQKKLSYSISLPPSTYSKDIEAHKVKHTSADIDQNINMSQFEHLAFHHQRPTHSCSQLRFETSLRKHSKEESSHKKQRYWCLSSKINQQKRSNFIKSRYLKKKIIQPEDMDEAFDGLQNYPKFTEKIVRQSNYNKFRHMMMGKVSLPSISWQVNLRLY